MLENSKMYFRGIQCVRTSQTRPGVELVRSKAVTTEVDHRAGVGGKSHEGNDGRGGELHLELKKKGIECGLKMYKRIGQHFQSE